MVHLTEIVDKVKSYHASADTGLIDRAYEYSSRMHDGQKRKSGDPYFVHPASVADIIADMKLDTASICAALLHDVVEDTDASRTDIESMFGEEVAFLVDGVTKLGRINFTCKEDQQAESFRKLLIAMARDIRVLLVKLADRLDNMRTLEHMRVDKQERIARETLEIYAPLAARLGIHWLKAELEDLSFRYLYPDAHKDLTRKVKKASRDSERYIVDVSRRLQKMLIERGFAVEVQGRVKHLYSIFRKMRRNNLEFEDIQDFVAFRILMENVADCYAALGVVHSQWTPIPGRFKDFVALPKPNMYQSLHTTVIGPGHRRIEVQIRTHEMHSTAEFGIAAHWQYKQQTGGLDARDAARFAWLRQMLEFQQEVDDPAEFFESVKVDLFPDEVYVFTPKGDVKTFPRGASPLDFAYSIHSEVGHHCVGARINGAMVPLRHKVKNGDVVEILTNNNQTPSKDWLDFVVTARARSRIRTYLRSQERDKSVKLGKELLEREMHKQSLSFSRYFKNGDVKRLMAHFKVNTVEEIFAQIGYGKLNGSDVVDVIAPREDSSARDSMRPSLIERTVRAVTRRDTSGITIEGIEDILVRYAKCCNPVPGDSITGWITRGRGVTVHRRECPKVMELDPQRRVEVSWANSAKVELPVQMRVVTSDKPGILANVSSTFTEAGVNINEANCRTADGRAVNLFQFAVHDVKALRSLMRQIQRIDGVIDVERV
ncbi:MAG: bifunctional (p)ppGpp synthetase/guanosine-3',5'-bis(diphosphate) 3'-pyrophosphohydrolase [Myxococcota bacterium]